MLLKAFPQVSPSLSPLSLRACACGSNIDIGFVVKLVTLIGDHALVDVAEILDQNHTQGLLSIINFGKKNP